MTTLQDFINMGMEPEDAQVAYNWLKTQQSSFGHYSRDQIDQAAQKGWANKSARTKAKNDQYAQENNINKQDLDDYLSTVLKERGLEGTPLVDLYEQNGIQIGESLEDLYSTENQKKLADALGYSQVNNAKDSMVSNAPSNSYNNGVTRTNVDQATVQQAAAENALSAQKQASESARASASAGINKPRAGMLADNSTQQNQTNNVPQLYGMAKNQTQTTSNDYLQKMAQADALDQQASNIQKGAALTAFGGAIQGGASGAMTGATLGMGSDENMKESPAKAPQTNKEITDEVTDEELNKAIRQFRELYRRVRKCQHR